MRVVLLIVGILSSLLAVLFLRGKGLFLAAGFNTMSEKEKALVDQKKLGKIMALLMAVLGLAFFLAYFDSDYMVFMILPLLALVLAFVIFGQRFILNEAGKSAYDRKKHYLKYFLGIPFYLLVLFLMFDLLYLGKIEVIQEDSYFSLRSDKYKEVSIDYRDIEEVVYQKDFRIGKKLNGVNNLKIEAGKFENEDGRYLLYAENNAEAYLLIRVKGLGLVVYGASVKEVESLHDSIDENLLFFS